MFRTTALALGLALLAPPAWAESEMRQSPLLMRRAGPSCRPGDLGGDPNAGYRYGLGPCAGADAGASGEPGGAPRQAGHRRRL